MSHIEHGRPAAVEAARGAAETLGRAIDAPNVAREELVREVVHDLRHQVDTGISLDLRRPGGEQ